MDFDKPWITFLLKELNLNGKKKKIRYHLTTVRMAIIKETQHITSVDKNVKKREPSFIVDENIN